MPSLRGSTAPTAMKLFATFLAAALGAALPAASAAQAPPIKPGLWEVERQVDGKQATPPADKMKNLTPETRARVEAMLKQQGVAIGSGGTSRVCLNKESLDAGRWHNQANCQTEFSARNASAWKWRSVCPQSETTIDGEAVFASGESYTINTTSTRTFRGDTKTTKASLHAKWLGADCGDLQPVDAKR
jgi:Protein of unknown function (DUF3617)